MDNQKTLWKKIAIVIFLCFISLSAALGGLAKLSNKSLDVDLEGYTDNVEKPQFSTESFFSGEYQVKFTSWFDTNVKPRGLFTKTYATIRYNWFHLGSRLIGYNNDIFDSNYVDSELCINPVFDMSLEQNREKMEQYVSNLELLQEKLDKIGKKLYVYLPANKADMHSDNLRKSYIAMRKEDSINAEDYLDALLRETSIPYLYTKEIGEVLEYPAFYTTGIHWSRPFEQLVSQRIMSDLCDITGKDYRKLVLGEINSSNDPIWRDSDVYDLLNVWNDPKVTYYEYSVEKYYPNQFDKLGMLLSGTSFGLGLRKDILDVYPTEELYFVNRNEYLWKSDGTMQVFNGDWSSLNLVQYLNDVDVVIIENIAPELANYSYGFVEHLLEVLDDFVPQPKSVSTIQVLDCALDAPFDNNYMTGFWDKEAGYVWITDEAEIQLNDPCIAETGLRLNYYIPEPIIDNSQSQTVHVYVNGKRFFSKDYNTYFQDDVVITADQLRNVDCIDGIYNVTIICENRFVPAELGMNDDLRELALRVTYIGGAK